MKQQFDFKDIQYKGDFALRPYLNIVREHTKPYKYRIFGKEIIIYPKVMSPKFEWSSELHIEVIKKRDISDKKVLDCGSGTGILGVFSYLFGAQEIIGVDLNPDAVENTKSNYSNYIEKDKFKAIKSDLFLNIKEEKFDIIIFNAPYHSYEADITNDYLEIGVADYQYKTLKTFLREVKSYLNDDGEIHLGFSDTGDLNLLYNEIYENNLIIEKIYDKFKNGYNVKVLILKKNYGLSFINDFHKKYLKDMKFDDVLFISCHHILESHYQLLVKLFNNGLKPENVYIIGKAYSTSNETLKKYLSLGFYVEPSSNFFDSFQTFNLQFKRNIKNFLSNVLNREDLKKYKKIIVWDDGGELIYQLNKKVKVKNNIIAIEQTSSGINKLEKIKLNFPVVNVAKSKSKLILESRFIAEDALKKIISTLGNCEDVKSVLIFGGGPIGINMKKVLLRIYKKVDIYDINPRLSDITKKEMEENFNNYELIIGGSGKKSVSIDLLKLSKGLKILASVSSSDNEFPVNHLRNKINQERFLIHRFIIHKTIAKDNVMLLNNGFPINFDGKPINVSLNQIQLTDTLILAGIYQLLTTKKSKKISLFSKVKNIIDLDKKMDEDILGNYLDRYNIIDMKCTNKEN